MEDCKMNNVIINADDCGKSLRDNDYIEEAIIKGLLTSTTIIANMDGYEGAMMLYNKYRDRISFGAHLNITEGEPLEPNDIFLKTGFCIKEDGKMIFNRLKYRFRYPNEKLRKAIYVELKAQMNKLISSGIEISHIDSHRHMHMNPFILPIVCQIAHEFHIDRIRRGRNCHGVSAKNLFFGCLNTYANIILKNFVCTDVFCSFDYYYNHPNYSNLNYELSCHPGHPDLFFRKEMHFIESHMEEVTNRCHLIKYDELQKK